MTVPVDWLWNPAFTSYPANVALLLATFQWEGTVQSGTAATTLMTVEATLTRVGLVPTVWAGSFQICVASSNRRGGVVLFFTGAIRVCAAPALLVVAPVFGVHLLAVERHCYITSSCHIDLANGALSLTLLRRERSVVCRSAARVRVTEIATRSFMLPRSWTLVVRIRRTRMDLGKASLKLLMVLLRLILQGLFGNGLLCVHYANTALRLAVVTRESSMCCLTTGSQSVAFQTEETAKSGRPMTRAFMF